MKPFQYFYYSCWFRLASWLRDKPFIPFNLWVNLTRIRFKAADAMHKVKRVDWDKELV